MNEQQALAKMVPPGKKRPRKFRGGVIQIWVTRACDKSCFNCTQGSNYGGNPGMITLEQFDQACHSLRDYWGVVGVFGGNPALHPKFEELCGILAKHIPQAQRGLWCNNPINESKATAMRKTFNPAVSNLNVHLDKEAFERFHRWWPEARPFGLDNDSRHSPVYVSPRDLNVSEEQRWELISRCDINQHWSAMIGVFRDQVRGYFCEIAGAMSMLKQNDPSWPDTGVEVKEGWWRRPMADFAHQVRQHCHDCGVPLKGYGELAQASGDTSKETTSEHWQKYSKPKLKERDVEIVCTLEELKALSLTRTTDYVKNAGV